ncbi:arginine repressor [Vibrio ostreicida]|uniref:Arginine repressor n=1 Tax=Vibrio ostreicida TaxID=526588 RepID=A0ABT8BR57_9VIBR|nr:arginine repressor [Vibrio ostreicida]MDN3608834.1 arginine repressor [Vibrio ostreicida]NPD10930.1 arginine repressor [Vibrio ostreicida]
MSETFSSTSVSYPKDITLTLACKRLLQKQSFSTQNDLREALIGMGFLGVSQSTVSRLLSQLGVIKVQNGCGKKVYCITVETAPVRIESSISSQIEFITHNQSMVVVKTHPGSAQLVARLVDIDPHSDILATVGGNDTVLIIPANTDHINQCEQVVRSRLGVS